MAVEALTGSPGTVGQITASAQVLQAVAKRRGPAILIIGHVTKEGNIAGPKILEHLVDVVLYLEGERYGAFKALRGVKNRFGSTSEVGIFEMGEKGLVPVPNPSEALLAERRPGPGSVVLATLEGTRPLLVEVQALVSATPFGYPKRTAVGFDLNRLNFLVAVLTKRAGLNLSSSDIYVNVVGGLRVTEPAADLAIILSVASALQDTQIPNGLVAFGEVGLSGEVRSVNQASRRVAEATKLGISIGHRSSLRRGCRHEGALPTSHRPSNYSPTSIIIQKDLFIMTETMALSLTIVGVLAFLLGVLRLRHISVQGLVFGLSGPFSGCCSAPWPVFP